MQVSSLITTETAQISWVFTIQTTCARSILVIPLNISGIHLEGPHFNPLQRGEFLIEDYGGIALGRKK